MLDSSNYDVRFNTLSHDVMRCTRDVSAAFSPIHCDGLFVLLTPTTRRQCVFSPSHSRRILLFFLFCELPENEEWTEREENKKKVVADIVPKFIKLNVERSRRSVATLSEFCQRRSESENYEQNFRDQVQSRERFLCAHLEGETVKKSSEFFLLLMRYKTPRGLRCAISWLSEIEEWSASSS